MADYKGKKRSVKQRYQSQTGPAALGSPDRGISRQSDPDSIMRQHPSWKFLSCDNDSDWSFTKERLTDAFWDVILQKLRDFESMTWSAILVDGNKQNHSLSPTDLNKGAQRRLEQLQLEAEAVYSLRLGGTLRLYGYMDDAIFNILWYDDNHGDNETCVCRSKKKHT